MGLRIVQVDAFTDTPFAGNPAAVCVLPEPRQAGWMQLVAREMQLSETAFLVRRQDGDGYDLRWFTPAAEVELCGHATLASAHVLWEDGHLSRWETAAFHTLSGVLSATCTGDWIELDFPAVPEQPTTPPAGLLQAVGVTPVYVGNSAGKYLLQVTSEDEVRRVQPDGNAIKHLGVRGVIVTSVAAIPAFDFVSRYFAPLVGIDEDPVTGSAHCILGPFWARHFHKNTLTAYQASARGGVVRVRVAGRRVYLAGQAVTVLRGELL